MLATILGFVIGLARLSPNWLLARLAGGYVELVRNLPLLFQILFWYLAVLGTLPGPRQSLSIFGEVFINNRGIIVPRPVFGEGSGTACSRPSLLAILAAVGAAVLGEPPPGPDRPAISGALDRARPDRRAAAARAASRSASRSASSMPQLRGFNFVGGMRLIPEFVALLIALATYTAAFIAEVVRAGVLAVSRGQTEAALRARTAARADAAPRSSCRRRCA